MSKGTGTKKADGHEAPTTQHVRARTLALQALFLRNYAAIGVITAAAKASGIDRGQHYDWLARSDKYPGYRKQFEDAHEQACDRLETEMIRRGVQGWDEPVFGKQPGKDTGTGVVGHIRKWSDRMLEIALKARRPEKFRERYDLEHSGPQGGPIEFARIERVVVWPEKKG